MPELHDDGSALGVDGIRHLAPAGDLRLVIATGGMGIALRLLGNLRRLGDDQPRRCPLTVLFRGKRARHQPGAGAIAGERRHDDAVVQLEGADPRRREKRVE